MELSSKALVEPSEPKYVCTFPIFLRLANFVHSRLGENDKFMCEKKLDRDNMQGDLLSLQLILYLLGLSCELIELIVLSTLSLHLPLLVLCEFLYEYQKQKNKLGRSLSLFLES